MKKENVILKERRKGIWDCLEEEKGREKKYNYIASKKSFKMFSKKFTKIFNTRYICICYIGNEYINILILVYKYSKYIFIIWINYILYEMLQSYVFLSWDCFIYSCVSFCKYWIKGYCKYKVLVRWHRNTLIGCNILCMTLLSTILYDTAVILIMKLLQNRWSFCDYFSLKVMDALLLILLMKLLTVSQVTNMSFLKHSGLVIWLPVPF